MASNIVLKTYAAGDNNQGSVTPQNDALIYQAAIPTNGIFFGATITLSNANTLHIAAGMGIIGGRFFEVLEDDIAVQLSSSGDLLGRLYIHLDLSNADNPISIETYTGASLPALTGDPNLNASNGSFDMELCTFDINELTISNIVSKFPTITAANNQIGRATAYAVNDFALCQSAGKSLLFICTTAGTTAVSEPIGYTTITDGNTITDGTAVFKAVGLTAEIDRTRAMIAPILTSLVAPSGGLSTGDQFIYSGLLYKATAAIAQGGTIVIGSSGNAVLADSVTEQIAPWTITKSSIRYTSGGIICDFVKVGRLATCSFGGTFTNALNNGASIDFNNIDNDFKPLIQTTTFTPMGGGSNAENIYFNFYTNGILKLVNYTGATIAAGTGLGSNIIAYITAS